MEKNEIVAEIKKDMANTLKWGREAAEGLRDIGKKLDLKKLAKEKIFNAPFCHKPLKECEDALLKHFEEQNEKYYFNTPYSIGAENAKWIENFLCEEYNNISNKIEELEEYLKILDEACCYAVDLTTTTKQLEELRAELSEYNEEIQ